MRSSPRALLAVLVVLAVSAPVASAAPLPVVLDDHVGDVDQRLQKANSTYGDRKEFQEAGATLGRAAVSFANGAFVVCQETLARAAGGLETGRARAQAGDTANEDVIDHGRSQATRAQSELRKVRGNLQSMERTGLEPVAFAGGLTAAYSAHLALSELRQYRQALEVWENGNKEDSVAATIVSAGAGANLAASVASDILERVTEARANATSTELLSEEELENLVDNRTQWVSSTRTASARGTSQSVVGMAENDEDLMALSGFTHFLRESVQDGLRRNAESQGQVDTVATAREVLENETTARAWIDHLGVHDDLALGALQSANFSLALTQNSTGQGRIASGAYAAGLAHLGVEQTGLLVEAFGGEEHQPTTALPPAPGSDDDGIADVPSLSLPFVALLVGLVAMVSRREPT